MAIRVLHYDRERSEELPGLEASHGSSEQGPTVVRISSEAEFRSEIAKGDASLIIIGQMTEWPWPDVLAYSDAAKPNIPKLLLLQENNLEAQRQAILAGARQTIARDEPDVMQRVLQQHIRDAVSESASAESKEALAAAERVLQKNQKSIALGLLLGSIAHEINNPLEGIGNLLYLAKRSKGAEDDVQACLDMAEAELSRVSEITKQMLSFHRDANRPEDFSVRDLLDGILVLFAAKLRERKIKVVRQFDCPGWMVAYPGELRQALVNLISNAIDAMPAGGHLTLKVRERPGKTPRLCVLVVDSGHGMSRERIKHFGELFATTKGQAGTGLGGWVTRKLVSKYGGDLRIYSSQRPGLSGTVMRLCFPHPHARMTGNTDSRATSRPDTRNVEQDEDDSGLRFAC